MDTSTLGTLLDLANKLGGASFATLLLLILWGSWREIWVWGRAVTRLTERYEALLANEKQDKEWWRAVAMRATGIAEEQATLVKKRLDP